MQAGTKHTRHPKLVGDQTEAMVIARLVQAGRSVLIPFGENHHYDILIDECDHFVRIQCKTGGLRKGAVWFRTCSYTYHHPNNRGNRPYNQTYEGQADLFGVYCPENDSVYLVPVADVATRTATLRIDAPLNNQSTKVRWAREYELRRPG